MRQDSRIREKASRDTNGEHLELLRVSLSFYVEIKCIAIDEAICSHPHNASSLSDLDTMKLARSERERCNLDFAANHDGRRGGPRLH